MLGTRDSVPPSDADDELLAYAEAGHAVAAWALGFGVRSMSLAAARSGRGGWQAVRPLVEPPQQDRGARRVVVEQFGMHLHAGDVAARFVRPMVKDGDDARSAHAVVHHWMYTVEDDGAVHAAWCDYLWQRTYTLLAWPGTWYLVVGLAAQLRAQGMLEALGVERYLIQARERLKHDPKMPNCVLVGEVTDVCSPWHRDWHARSVAAAPRAKRTEVPASLIGLTATVDTRPITVALAPLSTRAKNFLATLNIHTAIDLEDWNAWSLSRFRGGGMKTVEEIITAATRAGVPLATQHRYPSQLNPARWGRK